MSSKYIRGRERQFPIKGRMVVIEQIIAATIMPIYGTDAWDEESLPKRIERRDEESELEFKGRVITENNKFFRSHVKWHVSRKGIREYKHI